MAENCTQFLTLPTAIGRSNRYWNCCLQPLQPFCYLHVYYSGVPSAIINCWFVA